MSNFRRTTSARWWNKKKIWILFIFLVSILSVRISKGAQVSDWSRKELSDSQISYAATDAWISLELFKKFEEKNIV